jgi:hypothetical protein
MGQPPVWVALFLEQLYYLPSASSLQAWVKVCRKPKGAKVRALQQRFSVLKIRAPEQQTIQYNANQKTNQSYKSYSYLSLYREYH